MAKRASKADLEIRLGSVLAIPISDGHWALGQVLRPGTTFYLAIAGAVFDEPLNREEIGKEPFALYSWTNDAEVYNGSWKNIGVTDLPDPTILLPEYKIGAPGSMFVDSFDGQRLRVFDEHRDASLRYKKVRSPMLVEHVVKAASGVGVWDTDFEGMRQP